MITRFKVSAALLGAALTLLLGGCAPLAPTRYPDSSTPVRLALPYIPQDDFHCGASALAMVMAYGGAPVPLATLQTETYSPDLHGSLQAALVAAGRRHGWLTWEIAEFDEILAEVAAGRPVIILQNRGLVWRPLWHYAVVIGFDSVKDEIYLSSGWEDQRSVATTTVRRTWERGGRWGLLLLSPGTLPLHADPDHLLTALAPLELSNRDAARAGYAAALQRWPAHSGLAIAFGNLLRLTGEPVAAEAAYRAALSADPANVPALNNLADLLLSRGRTSEAHALAAAAVAAGGVHSAAAAATLQEVERAMALPDRP